MSCVGLKKNREIFRLYFRVIYSGYTIPVPEREKVSANTRHWESNQQNPPTGVKLNMATGQNYGVRTLA
jgi:hypothetical protein